MNTALGIALIIGGMILSAAIGYVMRSHFKTMGRMEAEQDEFEETIKKERAKVKAYEKIQKDAPAGRDARLSRLRDKAN